MPFDPTLMSAQWETNAAGVLGSGDFRPDMGEGRRGPQPTPGPHDVFIENVLVDINFKYKYTGPKGEKCEQPGIAIKMQYCMMDAAGVINAQGINVTSFTGEDFEFPQNLSIFNKQASDGNKKRVEMNVNRLFGFIKVIADREFTKQEQVPEAIAILVHEFEEAANTNRAIVLRIRQDEKVTTKRDTQTGEDKTYTNYNQYALEKLSASTNNATTAATPATA